MGPFWDSSPYGSFVDVVFIWVPLTSLFLVFLGLSPWARVPRGKVQGIRNVIGAGCAQNRDDSR